MSSNSQQDTSKDRAVLFEVLGRPIRIKVLVQLDDSLLGFSELKNALEIESSGIFKFHMGKLQEVTVKKY